MTETKKNSNLTIILIVGGVVGMVGICFIGLLVAIAVPGFIRARDTSRLNACVENQWKLDGAAQQFILENGLNGLSETPFAGKSINAPSAKVMLEGFQINIPVCPAGGSYTYFSTEGSVGETIYCDHDAHLDGTLDHPFPTHSNW